MDKVDIVKFRKEIIAIIQANKEKVTSFESKDDNSIFTFCGKKYICEVTIQENWISYDITVETPKGVPNCWMEEYVDLAPFKGEKYEKWALYMYDSLELTVNSLFRGGVYFKSNEEEWYIARVNKNNTYLLNQWHPRKFLFWRFDSGTVELECSKSEFEKLNLKVVS